MAIRSLVKRASFAEPWPERPAAKRQERETRGSAMAIRSLVKRASFAEPWPERPAAKRQEREKWLHFSRDDRSPIGTHSWCCDG